MRTTRRLMLSEIDVAQSVPVRARLDRSVVEDYAQLLASGGEFDRPLVVCRDKEGVYRLSEGFYRYEAMRRAGRDSAECEVRDGDAAEAFTAGFASNLGHGVRYTNADKNRAVRLLLEFHPGWTDARVAAAAGVSHTMVAAVRKGGEKPQPRLPRTENPASPLPPPPPPVPAPTPGSAAGGEDVGVDEDEDEDEDDEKTEVKVRVRPDRAAEAVGVSLRKVRSIRRLLSEVMAGPFAGLLREVAAHRPAWMLNQTGEIVKSGQHGSVKYGVSEYTMDPLDELAEFLGAARLALSRAAAKDVTVEADKTDPWDFGQEAGGGGEVEF